jgi:hypothetical protein
MMNPVVSSFLLRIDELVRRAHANMNTTHRSGSIRSPMIFDKIYMNAVVTNGNG